MSTGVFNEITQELALKVLDIVDQGLTKGLGHHRPGMMCVEAAVCYALGLPHSDAPPCVDAEVRSRKISLNDRPGWRNKKNRAAGMRRLAVAQLGTGNNPHFDSNEFCLLATPIAERAYQPGCGRPEVLAEIAEELVQLLIKMEAPGTKFLDLCPYAGSGLEQIRTAGLV
jgi:hypothetical protein